MTKISLSGLWFRYAETRMGDWKWRLWVGGPWLLRAGCVRHCWPYRYYHVCIGPVQVVLKYAPECRICLNDEHVLYPGKYCEMCSNAVRVVQTGAAIRRAERT